MLGFTGNKRIAVSPRKMRIILALSVLLAISVAAIVLTRRSAAQARPNANNIEAKAGRFLNIDIRLNSRSDLERTLQRHGDALGDPESDAIDKARDQQGAARAALKRLQRAVPTADITFSETTGMVEVLKSAEFLTAPAPGEDAETIALRFIREYSDIYGLSNEDIQNLHYVGESVNEYSGLRLALFDQMVNGRSVFQGDIKVSIDREGRVIQSLSNIAPQAVERAAALDDLISPEQALASTLKTIGIKADAASMTSRFSEDDQYSAEVIANDTNVGKVFSKIVYFPVAPGVIIPAWSQTIFAKDADWYALVDAANGTLLWRKNIRDDVSTHQARFRVYVQADGSTPADSPSPLSPSPLTANYQPPGIAPTIVSMLTVQNLTASPNGWIDDCPSGGCTAAQTQTVGNNVLSCLDRSGSSNVCDTTGTSALDGNGRPTGNPDAFSRNRDFLGTTPRDFQSTYTPPPQAGNPESGQTSNGSSASFMRGSATHQFYVANWYHDKLYTLGFTPAARNFQNNNFGGGGAGNDRINLDVQDGSGTNNANFSTPADGTSGRAQMYNFTGPTIDRDGGLDAEILIHELTHGTSNRLIGNGSGLQWDIGGGMGEGWSDFYALSLLNNTNADSPDGAYASGAYATYKLGGNPFLDNYTYGIRRFPYSTNNSVNPLTWADVDDVTNDLSGGITPSPFGFNNNGALEVHNVGEIWALTLWEVRSRIIADPAGANGDVPTGNYKTLSIATDAMRLFTPNNPSFEQARNALIDADCAANSCANEDSIWGGFADRGLGYKAIAPIGAAYGVIAGHIGIGESFASPNLDVNTVTVDDSASNNTGAIDHYEHANLIVNLRNPWRNSGKGVASATATLTTSTPGVTILQGSTTYPAIPANGNANPNGPALRLRGPASASCGSSIDLTLTITSSLGTVTRDIKLRMGVASGTKPAVTYTRSLSGLAIPDNAPRGVGDSMTINDDYEIADLNFRMDNLVHSYVGDVSAMLKAPNGYGTDLISLIGWPSSSGRSGGSIVNMVIDQTAAAPNDMRTATSGQVPFTDDFLPIFNTPSWTSLGLTPDPVGQLGRFNGMSTKGVWKLRVADEAAADTGTLYGWSLIVTPRNFVCTNIPTAGMAAISGRVLNANAQGLAGAVITATDTEGTKWVVRTSSLGYYRFDELPAGMTYILEVVAKGRTFLPRAVSVTSDLTDVDFMPAE